MVRLSPEIPKPTTQESKPEIQVISPSQPEVVLKENGRAKFTIDLQSIFKNGPKQEPEQQIEVQKANLPDKPVVRVELNAAWEEFAMTRKSQIAEYQLLSREFVFENNVISIPLSNPIEEPMLQNIRLQMTSFLRGKLGNHAITIVGVMREIDAKKAIYTNKEKFDHLAEKNPALRELKDRLGLDTDY